MGYTLGIVDEDPNQQAKIRRTIKANTPADKDEPEFKEYIRPEDAITSLEPIIDEIKSDISDHLIDGLIIDYALVMSSVDLWGSDIYECLNDLLPKLPIVLLTNYPGPCHELLYVDADKIYPKSEFFKLESTFSKEKVNGLLENISKYSRKRMELQQTFENEMNRFKEDDSDFELYSRLIATENELAKYSPQDSSTAMGSLNIECLREAVELIDRAYAIIEEHDETV